MRILWVCNVEIPIVSISAKRPVQPFGGWMDDLSKRLVKSQTYELYVLFQTSDRVAGGDASFQYKSFTEDNCKQIIENSIEEFHPDIVHIWGTEYLHSRITIDVCDRHNITNKCVISIQGVSSFISKHYCVGLPRKVVNSFTFRDFVKRDNIAFVAKKMEIAGEEERSALYRVNNIIGRTEWDRAVVYSINPFTKYHFCNESLRDSFYTHTWDINAIRRHSLFVSQSSYPIKGFHFMLQALPLIMKEFPDVHIFTTGKNLMNLSISERVRMKSYQKYLIQLIKKNHLENNITFLGSLSEKEMCDQYLKTHVFVSPSTIENSSNSICEAMLLGCPTISSFVGGAQTLLEHNQTGLLYQADAPYMLAYYVRKLFNDDTFCCSLSEKARLIAKDRHNRDTIYNNTISIYNQIMNG